MEYFLLGVALGIVIMMYLSRSTGTDFERKELELGSLANQMYTDTLHPGGWKSYTTHEGIRIIIHRPAKGPEITYRFAWDGKLLDVRQ